MRKRILAAVLIIAALMLMLQCGKWLLEDVDAYRHPGAAANVSSDSGLTPGDGGASSSGGEADSSADGGDGSFEIFKVVSCTPEETILEFTLPEYSVEEVVDEQGRAWQQISVEDTDNLNMAGFPSLPAYRVEYGLVPGGDLEAVLLDGEYSIIKNTVPPPATGPAVQGQSAPEAVPSDAVYGAGVVFPPNAVQVASTYQIRGIQGQGVQVSPFQYDDATSSVRVLKSGRISLKSQWVQAAQSDSVRDFAQLQQSQFVNSDSFRSASEMSVGTLAVILPDAWSESEVIGEYVEWRRKCGWKVLLGHYPSETGETPEEIQGWIGRAYSSDGVSHLMLLGDYSMIPPWQHASKQLPLSVKAGDHEFIATDTPYALLDGEDDLSYMDVMMGRIPTGTLAFAESYLSRMMRFEAGEFSDTAWNTRGIYIGSNSNAKVWPYAPVKDFAHILHQRQSLEEAKIMSDGTEFFERIGGELSGKATAVKTAIDEGASLLMYLGHGGCNFYETTKFSSYEANNLVNSGMLPFVVAPVCDTGNLDHGGDYDYICSNKYGHSLGQAYFETKDGASGVAGVLCAGNLVTWNPPLALIEEFTGHLCESQSAARLGTQGAYALAGIMRAVRFCDTYEADYKASYGDAYHTNGDYTPAHGIYHAWCLEFLGDPTSVVRVGTQSALDVATEFTQAGLSVKVSGLSKKAPVANCAVSVEFADGEIMSARTGDAGTVKFAIPPERLEAVMLRVLDGSGAFVKKKILPDFFGNSDLAEWLEEWEKEFDPEAPNASEMLERREAVLKAWREFPEKPVRPAEEEPTLEEFPERTILGRIVDTPEIREALMSTEIAVEEVSDGGITMLLSNEECIWLEDNFWEVGPAYKPAQNIPPTVLAAEIQEYLSALSFDYWPRIRLTTLGESAGGAPISGLRISLGDENENLPQLLVTAGIHGNETQAVNSALKLIGNAVDALEDSADPLNSLLKTHVLWIVPLLNPDGYDAGSFLNSKNADLERGFPQDPGKFANEAPTGIFGLWSYFGVNGNVETSRPQPEQVALVRWLALHQIDRTVHLRQGFPVSMENAVPGTLACWQNDYFDGVVEQCFAPAGFNLRKELAETVRGTHQDRSYLPGVPLALTIPEVKGVRVVRVLAPAGWILEMMDDETIARSGDGYIDFVQAGRSARIMLRPVETVDAEGMLVITAYKGEESTSISKLLVAPPQEETTVSLEPGWNYFSVPLAGIMPEKLGIEQLLVCRDGAYWSLSLDAPLEAGKGYAAFAQNAKETTLVASRVDAPAFACGTGAQLLGTVFEHAQSPFESMYCCEKDGFFRLMPPEESIVPGRAYWRWPEKPKAVVP